MTGTITIPRKIGEDINIGDDIVIRLNRIENDVVRLSIAAPMEVPIFRGELYREIQKQKEADAGNPIP